MERNKKYDIRGVGHGPKRLETNICSAAKINIEMFDHCARKTRNSDVTNTPKSGVLFQWWIFLLFRVFVLRYLFCFMTLFSLSPFIDLLEWQFASKCRHNLDTCNLTGLADNVSLFNQKLWKWTGLEFKELRLDIYMGTIGYDLQSLQLKPSVFMSLAHKSLWFTLILRWPLLLLRRQLAVQNLKGSVTLTRCVTDGFCENICEEFLFLLSLLYKSI